MIEIWDGAARAFASSAAYLTYLTCCSFSSPTYTPFFIVHIHFFSLPHIYPTRILRQQVDRSPCSGDLDFAFTGLHHLHTLPTYYLRIDTYSCTRTHPYTVHVYRLQITHGQRCSRCNNCRNPISSGPFAAALTLPVHRTAPHRTAGQIRSGQVPGPGPECWTLLLPVELCHPPALTPFRTFP